MFAKRSMVTVTLFYQSIMVNEVTFSVYLRNPINHADHLKFLLLLAAAILRLTDVHVRQDRLNSVAARNVYVISNVLFYLHILRLYHVKKSLGPKVIIIKHMVYADDI